MRLSRIPHVWALGAALTIARPTVAFAQPPRYCFEPSVTTADGTLLTLMMSRGISASTCWTDAVVGVDVYRRALGTECGDLVRITEAPLAWTEAPVGNDPYLMARIVDPTARPNTGYRYYARAVDANRVPVAANPDAAVGTTTTGEALVGHGRLVAGGSCGVDALQMVGCARECFEPLRISNLPDEAQQYVDSQTTVLVYGDVETQRHCLVLTPNLNMTRAVPAACLLGVESLTWGAAKRLYE